MARYIDADKIEFWKTMVGAGEYAGIKTIVYKREIDEIPSADVVEVVHGEWILETEFEDGKADYKCSVCDYDDTFYKNLVEHFYKYCPWCGALMDGKKVE